MGLTDVTTTGARRDERTARRLAMVTMAVVAAPLALTALHAGIQHWLPTGDHALIESRVRDVGTAATPLVGPYSRYGWNHPGPLEYFALAVPYRLGGNRSSTLLAAAALLNLICVSGIGVVAWRRGRLPLVLGTAVALAVFVRSMGPEALADPWNPYVTILPLALFLLLVWSLAEHDQIALPFALAAGTFLVQTHIGYAPIVGVATCWGLVSVRRRRDGDHPPRLAPRIVAASVAVVAIAWFPVVLDQLWGSHNLSTVAGYFLSPGEESVGFSKALGIVAREAGGHAPWLGGPEPIDPVDGGLLPADARALALPIAAFAAAAALAARAAARGHRRASAALRFQGLAASSALVGYVSVARITGIAFDYLVAWWWALAMLVWLATAWSFWIALSPEQRARITRDAAPLAFAAVAWCSWGAAVAVPRAEPPGQAVHDPIDALIGPTVAALPREGTLYVEGAGSVFNSVTDGLALQLERNGRDVLVASTEANKYGPQRTTDLSAPVVTVWVVSDNAIEEWRSWPGHREVATWDPLTPNERSLFRLDRAALRSQLLLAGRPELAEAVSVGSSLFEAYGLEGVDRALLERVDRQRARGQPVAVFLGPPPIDRGCPLVRGCHG